MATTPYWSASGTFPRFAKLVEDAVADVAVVGGGITGLTAASQLAKAGKRVVLLERTRCASTDTGHTSAHLTMVTDARLDDLVSRLGRSHAQATWDAGLAAIAHVDAVVREHQIDCDFAWVDGYLHAAAGSNDADTERDRLMKEAELACSLGFDAEFVGTVPFVERPGIRFAEQARVHPRRYLAGMAKAIEALGGRIYEHSEASEFCQNPRAVKVSGHVVTCDDVVIATDTLPDSKGRIVARIDGRNCYGLAKLDMIEAWLQREGLEREAVHIRFYSDHVSDAPVHRWCDEAFATTAHARLIRVAEAAGWQVLDWGDRAEAGAPDR